MHKIMLDFFIFIYHLYMKTYHLCKNPFFLIILIII